MQIGNVYFSDYDFCNSGVFLGTLNATRANAGISRSGEKQALFHIIQMQWNGVNLKWSLLNVYRCIFLFPDNEGIDLLEVWLSLQTMIG